MGTWTPGPGATGGADTFTGDATDETADGLGGNDTLIYSPSSAGVTVDLAAGTASGFSSISGVENVIGDIFGDNLNGDGFANRLDGGASGDSLNGWGGNDILIGGDGDDAIIGGLGDDSMQGGGGNDLFGWGLGDGRDTFGGDANANKINGNNGDDFITGAGGSDSLTGGLGSDWFVYGAGAGADTVNDFDAWAVGGQDFIDVTALGVTAGNFATRVTIIDTGADTVVRIDSDIFITLKNVSGDGDNVITSADFILA